MSVTGLANAFPKQRLSTAKKLENDAQWAKDMVDHIVFTHIDDFSNSEHGSDYLRKLSNYQLYNNVINQKDFEAECNPYGLNLGDLKDTIKPYNKTYNKINVLLGEELKRPFDYRTALIDQEGIRSKLIGQDLIMQDFIDGLMRKVNELISTHYMQKQPEGQALDEEAEKQLQEKIQKVVDNYLNPDIIEELQDTLYLDAREKLAYKTLEYLQKTLDLIDIKNDGFKHALISGEEMVWVGDRHGEPVCQVLNTLGVFYEKSPDLKWIQKANYAGYRSYLTSSEVLDLYGDVLKEKDIEKLEGNVQGVSGIRNDIVGKTMKYPQYDVVYEYNKRLNSTSKYEGQYGINKHLNTQWEVYHVEWKSQRMIYFIKYVNKFGDLQTDIASEDFTIPEYAEKVTYNDEHGRRKTVYLFDGMEAEKAWIPDVWEGVRIGDDIYCNLRRKKVQFRHMDNPYNVSLGYHGVAYSNMNAPNVSLMDRMRPFQYLLFIIVHRLKEFIALDRAPLLHFDITQVDPKIGLEKTMYYLDKLNINYYNPLHNAESAGAHQRGAPTGTTDRTTMAHINNYIALIDAIDNQISDVAGITRQREGQSAPYEAVSNNQQSIVQSTHITEIYFQTHSKLWEHILNSLLHVSQINWENLPKVRQYILDDLSLELINADDIQFQNANIGVFVTNSKKDNEIFNQIKQLAEQAISAGAASIQDIVKMIESGSLPKLKKTIKLMEAKAERRAQQAQEAEIKAAEEAYNKQKEMKQMELDASMQEQILKSNTDLAIKQMEIGAAGATTDAGSDNDTFKVDQDLDRQAEMQIKDKELRLKEKELKQKNNQSK